MKKIYIIPGYGEHCSLKRYQNFSTKLTQLGFTVIEINPDWYEPITKQLFKVNKNDRIFGFSYGAVLAYLVGTKYTCAMVYLASLSPIETFTFEELYKDNLTHMNERQAKAQAKDIKKIKINLNTIKGAYKQFFDNPRHYFGKKYADEVVENL